MYQTWEKKFRQRFPLHNKPCNPCTERKTKAACTISTACDSLQCEWTSTECQYRENGTMLRQQLKEITSEKINHRSFTPIAYAPHIYDILKAFQLEEYNKFLSIHNLPIYQQAQLYYLYSQLSDTQTFTLGLVKEIETLIKKLPERWKQRLEEIQTLLKSRKQKSRTTPRIGGGKRWLIMSTLASLFSVTTAADNQIQPFNLVIEKPSIETADLSSWNWEEIKEQRDIARDIHPTRDRLVQFSAKMEDITNNYKAYVTPRRDQFSAPIISIINKPFVQTLVTWWHQKANMEAALLQKQINKYAWFPSFNENNGIKSGVYNSLETIIHENGVTNLVPFVQNIIKRQYMIKNTMKKDLFTIKRYDNDDMETIALEIERTLGDVLNTPMMITYLKNSLNDKRTNIINTLVIDYMTTRETLILLSTRMHLPAKDDMHFKVTDARGIYKIFADIVGDTTKPDDSQIEMVTNSVRDKMTNIQNDEIIKKQTQELLEAKRKLEQEQQDSLAQLKTVQDANSYYNQIYIAGLGLLFASQQNLLAQTVLGFLGSALLGTGAFIGKKVLLPTATNMAQKVLGTNKVYCSKCEQYIAVDRENTIQSHNAMFH